MILITDPKQSLVYAVTWDSGWKQAGAFDVSSAVAVLSQIPETPGTYEGTIFTNGGSFFSPQTEVAFQASFAPLESGDYAKNIVLTGASVTDGELTGRGIEQKIREAVKEGIIDVFLNPIDNEFDIENMKGTKEFDTLIYSLLFTDARVEGQKGWLGDLNGNIFRSRIWTKDMSKLTPLDLRELEVYTEKALSYMIDNKIANSVNAQAMQTKDKEVKIRIAIKVGKDIIEKHVSVWRGK